MDKEVFPALRYALWNQEDDSLQNVDWVALLKEAEYHAVFGLVFQTMQHYVKQVADQMLLLDSIGFVLQIESLNAVTNKNMVAFVDSLKEQNIDYRVFKGQVVATCYPDPTIRQSGDVDIWVPYSQQSHCLDIIEAKYSKDVKRYGSEIHIEFDWHDTPFEVHQRLTSFVWNKHQKYFEQLLNDDKGMMVRVGETGIMTMAPTLNALYLFIHLFYHLVTEGVGLRQFCDWMMWLHKYKDDIDRKELGTHLHHLDLEYAYCVLGVILIDSLGLPKEEFPFEIEEKHRKRSQRVLKDVMDNGNFGRKKDVVHEVGLLHSTQTMLRMMSQCIKHASLAPSEVLLFLPQRFFWYYRKLLLKTGK